MPTGVLSIEKLADGIRITKVGGEVITITSADIPNGSSISSAQTFMNNLIASRGLLAASKAAALTPLNVRIAISDKPIPAGFLDTRMS